MPLQNRVLPSGEIVAAPFRGLFMGNRGCLHDDARRLVRTANSQAFWIVCETAFKDRRRALMVPGRYTELFFLDEAVALSAGHRPCAECRRAAFNAFAEAWGRAFGTIRPRAPVIDAALKAARRDAEGRQIVHRAALADLPDGTFVHTADGEPALRWSGALRPYRLDRYGSPVPTDPDAMVDVLTPEPTVAVLRAGYAPVVHPSAADE